MILSLTLLQLFCPLDSNLKLRTATDCRMCTGSLLCLGEQARPVYLVGAAHQLEDVHLRMRLPVVRQQGVQVGDGRERAVLVGHTVQVPERIRKKRKPSKMSANQQRRLQNLEDWTCSFPSPYLPRTVMASPSSLHPSSW